VLTAVKQNLVGCKFKDDRDMGTAVTVGDTVFHGFVETGDGKEHSVM
jgi:hypothetical protein